MSALKKVVVVAYGRSAVAKSGKKGALRQTHPVDLGGQVLKGILEQKLPQLNPALIEDVIVGCAQQDLSQSFNMARLIASAAAFQNIVDWLMALDISIYWKGIISTGVISGVAGSASSGARLTVQYLGDYFVSSGCNLNILHRLIALASITFDSLPHCTGCFLMFSYLGLNHKNAYKYTFLFDTVITLIVVIVCTLIASVMY